MCVFVVILVVVLVERSPICDKDYDKELRREPPLLRSEVCEEVYAVTRARAKQTRVLGAGTCLRLACAVFVVILIVLLVEGSSTPDRDDD